MFHFQAWDGHASQKVQINVENSDFELFYVIDKAYFVLMVSPYQVNG